MRTKPLDLDQYLDLASAQVITLPAGTVTGRHYDHDRKEFVEQRLERAEHVVVRLDRGGLLDLAAKALRNKRRLATDGPLTFTASKGGR